MLHHNCEYDLNLIWSPNVTILQSQCIFPKLPPCISFIFIPKWRPPSLKNTFQMFRPYTPHRHSSFHRLSNACLCHFLRCILMPSTIYHSGCFPILPIAVPSLILCHSLCNWAISCATRQSVGKNMELEIHMTHSRLECALDLSVSKGLGSNPAAGNDA